MRQSNWVSQVAGLAICTVLLAARQSICQVPIGGSRTPFSFAGRGSAQAVHDLLVRVLNSTHAADQFDLALVSECGPRPMGARSLLCFNVSSGGGKVVIRGTSAIELARGAGYYLRTSCNMSFSWSRTGGNQVKLPKAWPLAHEERQYRCFVLHLCNNHRCCCRKGSEFGDCAGGQTFRTTAT